MVSAGATSVPTGATEDTTSAPAAAAETATAAVVAASGGFPPAGSDVPLRDGATGARLSIDGCAAEAGDADATWPGGNVATAVVVPAEPVGTKGAPAEPGTVAVVATSGESPPAGSVAFGTVVATGARLSIDGWPVEAVDAGVIWPSGIVSTALIVPAVTVGARFATTSGGAAYGACVASLDDGVAAVVRVKIGRVAACTGAAVSAGAIACTGVESCGTLRIGTGASASTGAATATVSAPLLTSAPDAGTASARIWFFGVSAVAADETSAVATLAGVPAGADSADGAAATAAAIGAAIAFAVGGGEASMETCSGRFGASATLVLSVAAVVPDGDGVTGPWAAVLATDTVASG